MAPLVSSRRMANTANNLAELALGLMRMCVCVCVSVCVCAYLCVRLFVCVRYPRRVNMDKHVSSLWQTLNVSTCCCVCMCVCGYVYVCLYTFWN